MSLRIACDLDGTLADMESALQREAEQLFGTGVRLRGVTQPEADDEKARLKPRATKARLKPGTTYGEDERELSPDDEASARSSGEPAAAVGLSDSELRRLWQHVRGIDNFWLSLPEIEPGAVGRLFALSALHGWEVLFLTQRPGTAGETAQVQTQRWLDAHGFALPSVYVMNGSRGKVADALQLDAVIDDRPENCLDVITDSKARALLVWRDRAERVPPAAARLGIETTGSIAEALERLQQPARPGRGVVGRVRAAIGI